MSVTNDVAILNLLVDTLSKSEKKWLISGEFSKYVDREAIDLEGLDSYKQEGESDLSRERLLSRVFGYWMSIFIERKIFIARQLVTEEGSLKLSLWHYKLSKFGEWLANQPEQTKIIVLFFIQLVLKLKKLIVRHKWVVGAYGTAITLSNAAGHLLNITAYLVILVLSILIISVTFGIYNLITSYSDD